MTDANTCSNCGAKTRDQLCRACLAKVDRWARDIADLAAELETTIARQTRYASGGATKRTSDDTPLPIATGRKIDQAHAELSVLREWCAHIAGGPLATPAAGAFAGRLNAVHLATSAAAIIRANRAWFRLDAQAATAMDAIWKIRATLTIAVDRPPDQRWYAGPCGHVSDWATVNVCTAKLYATPGQDTITCDGHKDPSGKLAACGHVHSLADRRLFLVATLRDELVDLDTILAALPRLIGRNPDRGTVKKWRQRQKLVPRIIAGREFYRGGDIIDLALDRTTRPGPKRRDVPKTRAS